ncbi:MAG: ATP-dependent Clp protease ATP-binding subunit ClpX [Microscillaceae bacterium]|nr:ATP-dependent Clp protease ATP-binding subunit ClpX [Microscillaceae bacterium]MDW8461229.1 ATP-dependent Clp protease ATP-binding subunit ClpX [Cytophagales bacterium]
MAQQMCSFCGRGPREVNMLISGLKAHICDDCITRAHEVVLEERNKSKIRNRKPLGLTLMKPKEMKAYLDQFVVGQDEAKKILTVAVYNHYKRLLYKYNKPAKNAQDDDVVIEKSNIIMVGETGTGKTYLARTIAKLLDVPFVIADATVLTEAGYVGEDVESILSSLLQVANYDAELAERGIVYIDEIDKIARKGDNPSISRDVSGEGVQQALLKILEGSIVNVPPEGGRKHPEQKFVKINTENILFICGGAFEGIHRIIASRIKTRAIGFGEETREAQINQDNLLQYVTSQDLKTFGLIPELVGRLPIITHLNPLDRETIKRILIEPKNALIKQYRKLFQLEGIELEFEPEAIDYIVDKAMQSKLGARGLRGVCEIIMTDAMFEFPSEAKTDKLVITLGYAKEKFEKSKYNQFKAA